MKNNTVTGLCVTASYKFFKEKYLSLLNDLISMKIINCNFNDDSWKFKSRGIKFCNLKNGSNFSDELNNLIKFFLIDQVYRNRELSAESIVGRINAFRYFAIYIEEKNIVLKNLKVGDLNKFVEYLKLLGLKESTIYHRCGSLVSVIKFLNSLRVIKNNTEYSYLSNYISWKSNLENPTRRIEQIFSKERKEHSQNKYRDDIHIAIAKARSIIIENPNLELHPGYDRIRLESQAFCLALGLRLGELTTLPVHALDTESIPGKIFLRVAHEKTKSGRAVPVPKLWDDVLIKAYEYLLDACAEARSRAKDIEDNGFSFVDRSLMKYRDLNPLTFSRIAQINAIGGDLNNYIFPDELDALFAISKKSFTGDGSFKHCSINLPKPNAASIVFWLDNRFNFNDWQDYFEGEISLEKIASYCGFGHKNLFRQKWYIDQYIVFLNQINSSFKQNELLTNKNIFNEWTKVRQVMLQNRGGSHSFAVNLSIFKDSLAKKYKTYLSRHFDELFDENKDISDYQPSQSRAGLEDKLSNHLIVVFDRLFYGASDIGILPRPLFRSDIYNYFCECSDKKTIFERLNIKDKGGKIYSITSHMIRHWVTTSMLKSGPNEEIVDTWMGRQPRSGRQYDHRSIAERTERLRSIYISSKELPNDFIGRKIKKLRENNLSEEYIESLIKNKLRVVHITPWGSCSRELYVNPCSKSLMCIRGFGTERGCSSFQLDPSDLEAKKEIEKLLASNRKILEALEPNYEVVKEQIFNELNTSEPIDQHLAYLIDVINGCENALNDYKKDQYEENMD